MDEIVVGIDVGTTKVCTLVGRVEDEKSIDSSKVSNGDANFKPRSRVLHKEEVIEGHDVRHGHNSEEASR